MKLEREFMKPFLWIALAAISITPVAAAPLRLANVSYFSIYERTTVTTEYQFAANSTEVTQKLNTIYNQTPDFTSPAFERFDVYYSDANGNFDIDGAYLTLDCIYDGPGTGCNIAEVVINSTGNAGPVDASSILRLVSSTGYVSGSELLAIDGDTNTAASLGNSEGTIMSMTFGFNTAGGSEVPEPSTYALMTAGLAAIAWTRRR